MIPKALMQSLHFAPADLQANRAGQLSPKQRRYFRGIIFRRNLAYWLIVAFFYSMAIAIQPWDMGIGDGRFWGVLAVVLIATWGVHYLLAESETFTNDVKSGKVEQITGFVRCEYSEYSTGIRAGGDFYIQVHEHRFYVPWQAFACFEQGVRYTVYYLPNAHKVVSITPAIAT